MGLLWGWLLFWFDAVGALMWGVLMAWGIDVMCSGGYFLYY